MPENNLCPPIWDRVEKAALNVILKAGWGIALSKPLAGKTRNGPPDHLTTAFFITWICRGRKKPFIARRRQSFPLVP
jgi:hypothetical protein